VKLFHTRVSGSLIQNTMTSEVRFRAKLSEYSVERWQLGESLASADGAFALSRIRSYVSSKVQTAQDSVFVLS
jgi:hypothetical protein